MSCPGEPASRHPGVPILSAEAQPVRAVEERGGDIKNLYRCLANSPVLLKAWTDFAWTLRFECTTPRPLRELLILRASQLAGSRYLWEDHVRFGREAGLPEAQIEQLASWRDSLLFSAPERAALGFAEELVRKGRVPDELLNELERHFAPAEVIELALTVSFYAMAPRVIDALRVPLDR